MDITSSAMARGFICLAAIMDFYPCIDVVMADLEHAKSRLSRIEAVEEALAKHDKPEIFNKVL